MFNKLQKKKRKERKKIDKSATERKGREEMAFTDSVFSPLVKKGEIGRGERET